MEIGKHYKSKHFSPCPVNQLLNIYQHSSVLFQTLCTKKYKYLEYLFPNFLAFSKNEIKLYKLFCTFKNDIVLYQVHLSMSVYTHTHAHTHVCVCLRFRSIRDNYVHYPSCSSYQKQDRTGFQPPVNVTLNLTCFPLQQSTCHLKHIKTMCVTSDSWRLPIPKPLPCVV